VIHLSQWFITLCFWLYYISITSRVIRLSQWFITLCLWLYCISIISRVIRLSQWFITLCLWLYCISITSRVYHSDLSRYVSDCTVSVKESKKEVLFFIRLLLTTPYFHDIFLCKFLIHVSNLSTLYIENSVLVGSFWSLNM
jgi:hypothetical protein